MTLMRGISELYNHVDKTKIASFIIEFPSITRRCTVSKYWSNDNKEWRYCIHETYCPMIVYTEDNIIPALAAVSGIQLCGNISLLDISDVIYTDLD